MSSNNVSGGRVQLRCKGIYIYFEISLTPLDDAGHVPGVEHRLPHWTVLAVIVVMWTDGAMVQTK